MNGRLPECVFTLCRWAGFSCGMAIFMATLSGCQHQDIMPPTPVAFSIEHVQIIDSPNRYGGSVSDTTLQLLERRIRDYGLSAGDVWFIYLRATSSFDPQRHYAEVYFPPRMIEGRLYGGEFLLLRTESVEQRMAEWLGRSDKPIPSPIHPYWWVRPLGTSTEADRLASVRLNTLPIQPLEDYSPERVVALMDLMHTTPKMPDTVKRIEIEGNTYEFAHPGQQVDPNRPIWEIEGTMDEPVIRLLESDGRRKRGQSVSLHWADGQYEVQGIGFYGTSTNWFFLY